MSVNSKSAPSASDVSAVPNEGQSRLRSSEITHARNIGFGAVPYLRTMSSFCLTWSGPWGTAESPADSTKRM